MANFVQVSVILTPKEYQKLKFEGAFLAEGTVGAALRKRAGMPEAAYGLIKARRENKVQPGI